MLRTRLNFPRCPLNQCSLLEVGDWRPWGARRRVGKINPAASRNRRSSSNNRLTGFVHRTCAATRIGDFSVQCIRRGGLGVYRLHRAHYAITSCRQLHTRLIHLACCGSVVQQQAVHITNPKQRRLEVVRIGLITLDYIETFII